MLAAVVLAFVLATLMAATFALLGFWTTQTSSIWMLWWGRVPSPAGGSPRWS